ncbi:MAG: hypothetical protein L3K03_07945 [Thermoplasmata archaeon]|nr:hypothetical protein [Thermoplasmata archaeon]
MGSNTGSRSSPSTPEEPELEAEPWDEESPPGPPTRRGRPAPVVRVASRIRRTETNRKVWMETLPLLAGGAALLGVGLYLWAIRFGVDSHPFPLYLLLVICGAIAIIGGVLSLVVVEDEVVMEYRTTTPPPTPTPSSFPARPEPYTRSSPRHTHAAIGPWRTVHGRAYRAPRSVTRAMAGEHPDRTRSRIIAPPVVAPRSRSSVASAASFEDDELARIHLDVISGNVPETTRSSHEVEFDQLLNELDGLSAPVRPVRLAELDDLETPAAPISAGPSGPRSFERTRSGRRRLCGSCDNPIASGDRAADCTTCGQPSCTSCHEMAAERGHPGICSMCTLLHADIPPPSPTAAARIRGNPVRG